MDSTENIGAAEILSANGKNLDFAGWKPTYAFLPSYDHLIDSDGYYNEKLWKGAGYDLKVTIAAIKKSVKNCGWQVRKLAAHLKAETYGQSCFNVWHFMKVNMKYSYDDFGKEQVRDPDRSWHDRNGRGIDCEDMAIFANCLLNEMYGALPAHLQQIVGFSGGTGWQHIYFVAKGIVVDAVMNNYGQHPDNITRRMEIFALHGVPKDTSKSIAGLGALAPANDLTTQLIAEQTKELARLKKIKSPKHQDLKELRKLRLCILANGTPEQSKIVQIMPMVKDINHDGHYIFKEDIYNRAYYEPDQLDLNALSETDKAKVNSFVKMLAGVDDLGAIDDSDVEDYTIGKKAKKAGAKPTDGKEKKPKNNIFKKIVKAVKKVAPPLVAARNAFLLAMKLNFGGIASKAKTAMGAKVPGHKNAYDKFKKLFVQRLGGSEKALKKAIDKGYKKKPLFKKLKGKKLNGIEGVDYVTMEGVYGLGEIALAASLAAAAPLLIAAVKIFKDSGLIKDGEDGDITASLENGGEIAVDQSNTFATAEDAKTANDVSTAAENEPGGDGEDKTKKYLMWGGGALALIGIGYFATRGK